MVKLRRVICPVIVHDGIQLQGEEFVIRAPWTWVGVEQRLQRELRMFVDKPPARETFSVAVAVEGLDTIGVGATASSRGTRREFLASRAAQMAEAVAALEGNDWALQEKVVIDLCTPPHESGAPATPPHADEDVDFSAQSFVLDVPESMFLSLDDDVVPPHESLDDLMKDLEHLIVTRYANARVCPLPEFPPNFEEYCTALMRHRVGGIVIVSELVRYLTRRVELLACTAHHGDEQRNLEPRCWDVVVHMVEDRIQKAFCLVSGSVLNTRLVL